MKTIDPVVILEERFSAAIAGAFADAAGAKPLVTAGRNAKLGDFQSNAAMPLGKRLGMKPREVAEAIVAKLEVADIAEPLGEDSIAGPGFINVRLKTGALGGFLEALDTPALGIEAPEAPETVVVDLCSVNLAKQMHVGHLRSTVIGDAAARLFTRLGHTVIRQSHVGDWGLPIAMVVQKLIELEDAGEISGDGVTLGRLNGMYKAAQAECKSEKRALELVRSRGGHPKAESELEERISVADAAMGRAKSRLVALQSGEARTVAVWQRIYDTTMRACLATCARLRADVTAEHSAGESAYRDELPGVIDDLAGRGIAEESDGALVVRVKGLGEPCLVRKRDGGFLYATTDLAAIRRRVGQMGASRIVYFVDARQSLHFKLVFGAAHKAGYDQLGDGRTARMEHAAFGTVLGENNKPLKTRSGENIKLDDLLDEAVRRAAIAVGEKNPEMSDGERGPIAEAVAMAAVKYADLSGERVKDYVFSFDRMLAFEGDTGPYLLYALVRVKSIFRKAEADGVALPGAGEAIVPVEAAERALALKLLRYPSVVRASGEACEPHRLCGYLFELATAFSAFFEQCPVLRAGEEATRGSRLRLCALTARVLGDGLGVLGIPTVERM